MRLSHICPVGTAVLASRGPQMAAGVLTQGPSHVSVQRSDVGSDINGRSATTNHTFTVSLSEQWNLTCRGSAAGPGPAASVNE